MKTSVKNFIILTLIEYVLIVGLLIGLASWFLALDANAQTGILGTFFGSENVKGLRIIGAAFSSYLAVAVFLEAVITLAAPAVIRSPARPVEALVLIGALGAVLACFFILNNYLIALPALIEPVAFNLYLYRAAKRRANGKT